MKVYASYDKAGNIFGVAIPSDERGKLSLDPQAGEFASEFDVADVSDTQRHELLRDFFRNYRVERLASGENRLTKKDHSERKD